MIYKHKTDVKITGFLPAIFSVIVFAFACIIWDLSTGFNTLGSIIILYSLLMFYGYLRTKHIWSLLSAFYMICYGGVLFLIAPYARVGEKIHFTTEALLLFALTLIIMLWLIYLNAKKKLKWRGREILELAAQQVNNTEGSYTERPRPMPKVNYSEKELIAFASYFEKNLLGLCYRERNRVVFMPLKYKNEYFALYNPNYNYVDKTWVAISFNGNITVNISKLDYLDFKEDLAFDQLCNSLNDVILEFIQLYLDGSEVRIIDKMNNLRINVFV